MLIPSFRKGYRFRCRGDRMMSSIRGFPNDPRGGLVYVFAVLIFQVLCINLLHGFSLVVGLIDHGRKLERLMTTRAFSPEGGGCCHLS